MATSPVRSTSATGSSARKATKPRGPQKRTFHFFMKVVDANGTPIPGAQLRVERIISDARKVIEFMDTPEFNSLGLTRVKHEVHSTPRGDVDGESSVG